MVKKVAPDSARTRHGQAGAASLYDAAGGRKYLNAAERARALAAASALPPEKALFVLTLAWTGARVSEVLALTPASFQVEREIVALTTLKRRRHHVREVPIPPFLMQALEAHYDVSAAQLDADRAGARLWPWHRTTAWRIIKGVMTEAQIVGRQASPRGLRHAFGVGALQAGVPLNLVQRWLGHARMRTTAIYADVSGPEERMMAARFWEIPTQQQILDPPGLDSLAGWSLSVLTSFTEASTMMARRFESGFELVERCQRELPPLADYFAHDSAMRAALNEVAEAARKVDCLLRHSNQPVTPVSVGGDDA